MQKFILKYSQENRWIQENKDFGYQRLNQSNRNMVDLGIVLSFLDHFLLQIEWSEVDIFSNDFSDMLGDEILLRKRDDFYYLSYSFEDVLCDQCPSFVKKDFIKFIDVWNELMKQKPKYIILSQSDDKKFTLEGKDVLSPEELQLIAF